MILEHWIQKEIQFEMNAELNASPSEEPLFLKLTPDESTSPKPEVNYLTMQAELTKAMKEYILVSDSEEE